MREEFFSLVKAQSETAKDINCGFFFFFPGYVKVFFLHFDGSIQ